MYTKSGRAAPALGPEPCVPTSPRPAYTGVGRWGAAGEVRVQQGEPGRVRRGRLLGVTLIALLLGIWIVWWQWDAIRRVLGEPVPAVAGPTAETATPSPEPAATTAATDARRLAEQRWAEMLGAPPVWPADFAAPGDCEQVEAELTRVCGLLDAREYIRAGATPTGACGLARQLAEELASRPPQISSELKSYETMLDNVFHVYRTLGRRRTQLLRRIVWEETELTEPAALALFRWSISRERCAGPRDTPLTLDALYAHAGFLFQTLGGQAYLRRRPPRTEGLIGFYALVVIDRAQAAGHNPAGVDPRPEIQRVRALLGREPLVFRDDYLRVLDEMAARWKRRSEP